MQSLRVSTSYHLLSPEGMTPDIKMDNTNDTFVDDNTPPPAYHDGRGIERLPSYRHGFLARHHPYGRYTPSLLQRLLLTPYAYDFDYASMVPANDAIVGVYVGVENSAAASTAISVREHADTPLPASSSSARTNPNQDESASHDALNLLKHISLPTPTTSRSLKRKRDDFEGQDDSE